MDGKTAFGLTGQDNIGAYWYLGISYLEHWELDLRLRHRDDETAHRKLVYWIAVTINGRIIIFTTTLSPSILKRACSSFDCKATVFGKNKENKREKESRLQGLT